ncbi:MAG: hypothetical protein DMF91_00900 [Acidobacteria bacterium]|nr:MAG: hypothetical protein DMF91_00900 [Acidobacteriota bacterium]
MDLRGPGPDVIGDRQRAAPRLGRDRTFEPLQDLDAVAIRHPLHGNRGERRDVLDRQTLRAGR